MQLISLLVQTPLSQHTHALLPGWQEYVLPSSRGGTLVSSCQARALDTAILVNYLCQSLLLLICMLPSIAWDNTPCHFFNDGIQKYGSTQVP